MLYLERSSTLRISTKKQKKDKNLLTKEKIKHIINHVIDMRLWRNW